MNQPSTLDAGRAVMRATRWLAALTVLWWAEGAMACPMCKEALFDPAQLPQRLSTARGYAASIALMLGMPLLLIGGVVALIVRAQRRARTLR